MTLGELTEAYQVAVERHRSASARLEEQPFDEKLERLVADLAHCVDEAWLALYREWEKTPAARLSWT